MFDVTKSLDDYFVDWEADAFGYGYGSGEPHVIPALRRFFELCVDGYDHVPLEQELTPVVAWLLINRLVGVGIIEYGSSPRFGWLTPKGKRLAAYVLSKTADELVTLICSWSDENRKELCYPNVCHCAQESSPQDRQCPNPFWRDRDPPNDVGAR